MLDNILNVYDCPQQSQQVAKSVSVNDSRGHILCTYLNLPVKYTDRIRYLSKLISSLNFTRPFNIYYHLTQDGNFTSGLVWFTHFWTSYDHCTVSSFWPLSALFFWNQPTQNERNVSSISILLHVYTNSSKPFCSSKHIFYDSYIFDFQRWTQYILCRFSQKGLMRSSLARWKSMWTSDYRYYREILSIKPTCSL